MSGTSLDAANEFIRLAREDGRELTQMQLQKLVYIAHGWRLALTGEPLTTDAVQAWDFGPVYPELYERLRSYGRSPVSDFVKSQSQMLNIWFGSGDSQRVDIDLDDADRQVIRHVYEVYGAFPAFQLSALTHQANTPWSQVYERNGNRSIPNAAIEAHFKELAEERVVGGRT